MKYLIAVTSFWSSDHGLTAFRKGSALAALIALGSLFGCAGPVESGDESANVDTHSDQLVADAVHVWEFKGFSPINSLSTLVGDPAFSTANVSHSYALFSRDTSNFIQCQSTIGVGGPGNWAKYGSGPNPRQLGGNPAVGFLAEAPGNPSPYPFILLAKGAVDGVTLKPDTRLFWSKGQWTIPQTAGLPPAPTAVTSFVALDNTQYKTNGNPAVATHNGRLVVVYLDDNGQLLANYWTAAGTFSPTLHHPLLPNPNWKAFGTPTIAFVGGWAQKFVIFVRVTYGSVTAVYETFFQDDHFTGASGGPTGVYQYVPVNIAGHPMTTSNLAYEYDDNDVDDLHVGTLYWRSGTTIYQASASNGVDQFDTSTVKAITNSGAPVSIKGNPVVLGNVQFEAGRHQVLARGTDNAIYWAESLQDTFLTPN